MKENEGKEGEGLTSTPLIPAKMLIEFVVKIERSDMYR